MVRFGALTTARSAPSLLLLAACNRYDLFRVVGPAAEGPRDADLLFVVDASESMREETIALAENFGGFVSRLSRSERAVDLRLAITTTDADALRGGLVGPVLAGDDPDVVERFVTSLLCDAACFPDRFEVPFDTSVTCDQGFTGKVSREALDCLCGFDAWVGHCGSGAEAGLESVLLAACRAVDAPPERCGLEPGEARTNTDLLRKDALLVPIVVTDEGDDSPRLPPLEPIPTAYGTAFAELGVPTAWVVVGPTLGEDLEPRCGGLPTSWGIVRYQFFVQDTGGLYEDVFAPDCAGPAAFGPALDRVSDLLAGGLGAVHLPEEPVRSTLTVEVGDRAVRKARVEGIDIFGRDVWSDGWSYTPETRTVVLHGDARPREGELARVYFLPVTPRGR